MNIMKIEIYSDLICPWRYIGKRRMQAGLEFLGKKFSPKTIWRPFPYNSGSRPSSCSLASRALRYFLIFFLVCRIAGWAADSTPNFVWIEGENNSAVEPANAKATVDQGPANALGHSCY